MEEEQKPEVNNDRRKILETMGITVVGFLSGITFDQIGHAAYAEQPTPPPKQEPKPDPILNREREILRRAAIIFPDSIIIPEGYSQSYLEMIYSAQLAAGREPDFPLEFTIAQIDKECRSKRTDFKRWDPFAVSSQLALGMAQFMRATAESLGAKTYTREDSRKLWDLEKKIDRINRLLKSNYSLELEMQRNNEVARYVRLLEKELKGQKDLAAFDERLSPPKAFSLNARLNRQNLTTFMEMQGGEPYLNAQNAIVAYNIGIEEALKYDGMPFVEETNGYKREIMKGASLLIGYKGKLYSEIAGKSEESKSKA